jgi:hypothetical protein
VHAQGKVPFEEGEVNAVFVLIAVIMGISDFFEVSDMFRVEFHKMIIPETGGCNGTIRSSNLSKGPVVAGLW